jgi:hypothetical protein
MERLSQARQPFLFLFDFRRVETSSAFKKVYAFCAKLQDNHRNVGSDDGMSECPR